MYGTKFIRVVKSKNKDFIKSVYSLKLFHISSLSFMGNCPQRGKKSNEHRARRCTPMDYELAVKLVANFDRYF